MHDVDVLTAGIPKVVKKDLPLIVDFEKSKFQPGTFEKISILKEKLLEGDVEYYFVSRVLKGADAKSFEEVLGLSENPSSETILKTIELEDELQKLEAQEEELLKKIKESRPGGLDYQTAQIEREKLKVIAKVLDESINKDQKIIHQFSKDSGKDLQSIEALKKTKEEILKVMADKGVSF